MAVKRKWGLASRDSSSSSGLFRSRLHGRRDVIGVVPRVPHVVIRLLLMLLPLGLIGWPRVLLLLQSILRVVQRRIAVGRVVVARRSIALLVTFEHLRVHIPIAPALLKPLRLFLQCLARVPLRNSVRHRNAVRVVVAVLVLSLTLLINSPRDSLRRIAPLPLSSSRKKPIRIVRKGS